MLNAQCSMDYNFVFDKSTYANGVLRKHHKVNSYQNPKCRLSEVEVKRIESKLSEEKVSKSKQQELGSEKLLTRI